MTTVDGQPYGESPQPTSTVAALQERVVYLEMELVKTRMQLACARSSHDNLEVENTNMRSLLGIEEGALRSNENTTQANNSQTRSITVPTAGGPFSPENIHTSKILNPGSCSSALDLLGMSQIDSINSTDSMDSTLDHNTRIMPVLNPNSCSSGLNLILSRRQGRLYDDHDNMLYMPSDDESEGPWFQGSISNDERSSDASSSVVSLSYRNNFALLFGKCMLSTSSSSRRDEHNRSSSARSNNARPRGRMKHQGTKRNADWDNFE